MVGKLTLLKRYVLFSLLALSASSSLALAASQIVNIPYKLVTQANTSSVNVSGNQVTIVAKKGTDLYTNAAGSTSADNAPRVFFEPKSDFIFSAKVHAKFSTAYDGGALFLYVDGANWGKLLFERFKSGDNGIASTVTRSSGDDAYHVTLEQDEIYLQIKKVADVFIFSYSETGEGWRYLRSFNLKSKTSVKVGFVAQSPISEKHEVTYSDIRFEQ